MKFLDSFTKNLILFSLSVIALVILLLIPCKNFLHLILISISLVIFILSGINLLFAKNAFKAITRADDSPVKKYAYVDVHRFRKLFLNLGFILTLVIIILSFNWRNCEVSQSTLDMDLAIPEDLEVDIPPTEQKKPPPPPPPPPKIEIVENEEIIEDEPEIEDVEVDEETAVEVIEIEEEVSTEEEIFLIVEESATFPGGMKQMYTYLGKNIKYPAIARENGVEGKVYLNFVVEKDGSITNIKVLRGIGGGCDEEAIRVVKGMPKWSPGKQRGIAVRQSFNLPINFMLNY